MSITDTLTAEYFCSVIGVTTVETTSVRKSNSIEGDFEEYGQKNISTQKRNLLNVDEILRIPSSKLLVNIRGNKPLLLDKIIYKEHPLAKKLKDSPITDYHPTWSKNLAPKEIEKDNNKTDNDKVDKNKPKISWETF
jgi:type IV secretory pathway TraG/TraD family ATPase VirD4